MLQLNQKYKPILLESLEDLMYKTSLQLEELKGQPMSPNRQKLTDKQKLIEELQHLISVSDD
ncbi:MAG: hypothetical protein NXI20_07255 [bacterium]|nr:hypothetical protein [bacterium]